MYLLPVHSFRLQRKFKVTKIYQTSSACELSPIRRGRKRPTTSDVPYNKSIHLNFPFSRCLYAVFNSLCECLVRFRRVHTTRSYFRRKLAASRLQSISLSLERSAKLSGTLGCAKKKRVSISSKSLRRKSTRNRGDSSRPSRYERFARKIFQRRKIKKRKKKRKITRA